MPVVHLIFIDFPMVAGLEWGNVTVLGTIAAKISKELNVFFAHHTSKSQTVKLSRGILQEKLF